VYCNGFRIIITKFYWYNLWNKWLCLLITTNHSAECLRIETSFLLYYISLFVLDNTIGVHYFHRKCFSVESVIVSPEIYFCLNSMALDYYNTCLFSALLATRHCLLPIIDNIIKCLRVWMSTCICIIKT